jgi:hypothetical protein
MENLFTQKVINANNVFDGSFLDAKTLYLYSFNLLPSIRYIGEIDGEKAFGMIREKLVTRIQNVHQSTWYKQKRKRFEFGKTIVVMDENCILEMGYGYCEYCMMAGRRAW